MIGIEVFESVIDTEMCSKIVCDSESLNFNAARIYTNDSREFKVSNDSRVAEELSLSSREKFSWLIEHVKPYVSQAAESFGFDSDNFWVPQGVRIIKYAQGSFHTWHSDMSKPTRVLTVVVQLSPDEYCGADLEFKVSSLNKKVSRNQGSVMVFPSSLIHRVSECCRGTRYSAVMWFENKGKELPDGFVYV